jgi:dihydrofolate reductase
MKTKVSVFLAMSLDGFIAREDGNLDWLDKANELATPGEDCGYKAFFETVDVLVMGRNTFEKVLTFGEWPYASKKVVVLSHRALVIPSHLPDTVCHMSGSPAQILRELSSAGAKHVYLDGGVTVQKFLREGLVDNLTLTIVPVLIGSGKPLFGDLEQDIKVKLVDSIPYSFGYVQLKYVCE